MARQTDGPYDGQNWPTHHLALWIANDGTFTDTASNYAKLDENGEELRKYMQRLLFDRSSLAEPEQRRLTRDDVRTLNMVTGDLAQDDENLSARKAFDKVNWRHVREELLT
ncbi:hypothetical protein ACFW2V_13970 [Streptomyces sp. NPDC058947]|uniref:hypothetical protein n=1 Tax=Streptomyces sp. NPDC058947 TaxID=3346675 RepID=UPI003696C56B